MKKIMKGLGICLAAVTSLSITACREPSDSSVDSETSLAYYDQLKSGQDYNHNLYYQNDMLFDAADISVLYIDEGEESGYFYAYATSDSVGAYGFLAWRSNDLVNWQSMGMAFEPQPGTWGTRLYWAPEVIYNDGKYYMYYTAADNLAFNATGKENIGLAVADSPAGPFVQWTGTTQDNRTVGMNDVFLDLTQFSDHIDWKTANRRAIDAAPFLDDDGKLYLYFVAVGGGENSVWGLEMKDWFSPDYSTLKYLAKPSYYTPGGQPMPAEITGNAVNEGPFMVKHNGKYYLTYNPNGYRFAEYAVNQAISDGPLGDFVKVDADKGGRVICYKGTSNEEYNYDYVAGTGHGSMVNVNGDLLYFYHAYKNRETLTLNEGAPVGAVKGRGLCVDRVFFVDNGEQEVLYANGPSYSLQPLPEVLSGYSNVAKTATVTATNAKNGSGAEYLNDYLYKSHDLDFIKEFEANGQETTVTLKWDAPQVVRTVMVYNAFNYLNSFDAVESIKIKAKVEQNGAVVFDGYATLSNLGFDMERHAWVDANDATEGQMRPGGASIAEFDELVTDEIIITVKGGKKNADGVVQNLMIGDIVVLGKPAGNQKNTAGTLDSSGKFIFNEYSYTNPVFQKRYYPAGDGIEAYDGFNFKDYENGVIIQEGGARQDLYFNNLTGTQYYLEATLTLDRTVNNDTAPKIGMIGASNSDNKLALMLDPGPTFAKRTILTTEYPQGANTWLWPANNDYKGLTYAVHDCLQQDKDGNQTIKMSVVRDGTDFYFFVNGVKFGKLSNITSIGADKAACPGFITMNLHATFSDIKTSTDPKEIAAYIAKHSAKFVAPEKTIYSIGEELDLSGGGISVIGDDGTISSTIALNHADVQIIGDASTAGEQVIKVIYNDVEYSFTITVLKGISEISEVDGLTATRIGEEIDLNNKFASVIYSDGTSGRIALTEEMITGYDRWKSGKQTLTVTISGKTKEIEHTVVGKLGNSQFGVTATAGFDLSGDINDANALVTNASAPPQRVFFSEVKNANYILNIKIVLGERKNNDNAPRIGVLMATTNAVSNGFGVQAAAVALVPGIGEPLPHASIGSFITGWNWKESGGYGFAYSEGQNKNTVSLTIVKAGKDFYVQINGGDIVKETYMAFEGEATPGLFTMNYSGEWSDYSYSVGETAVKNWLDENDTGDSSDTTGKVKTIDGDLADWTSEDKTTAFDLQGTGDYTGKQFTVYGKYVVGDGVYVAAVVVHREWHAHDSGNLASTKSTAVQIFNNMQQSYISGNYDAASGSVTAYGNNKLSQYKIKTVYNAATNLYTTVFEYYMAETDLQSVANVVNTEAGYVRMGWAFCANDGTNKDPFSSVHADGRWLENSRLPGQLANQYYIYADGIYASAKA